MHDTSTRPPPIASGCAQVLILLGIAALASTPVGCSNSTTCEESGTCINTGPGSGGDDAGTDADGSSPVPPDCDLAADAKDSPACVDDAVGVFVDGASGLDSNPGTKAAPVRSIGIALGRLGTRARIYICGEGPYEEQLDLTASVSLYGGFACAAWAHDGTKAKVAPPAPGYALHVAGAVSPIVIADLDFTAKDAVEPGGSSVAVFLSDSANVTFRRVHASAGKGVDAASTPTPPSNLFSEDLNALKGNPPAGTNGGAEKSCACEVYGSSTGGKGANGGDPAPNGEPGAATPMPVAMPSDRDGLGGLGYSGVAECTSGHAGADGVPRPAGAGANKLGALISSGWIPQPGANGQAGNPGGGGGGGGGGYGSGGGGGGGGCGGCGGSGGHGGDGGGGSIALATLNTTLRLETVSLRSSDAGRGADASAGTTGGAGGEGERSGVGCGGGGNGGTGGVGGNGAGGGGGGGGAGGISVGILRSGGTLDGSPEVTLGTPGNGGAGAGGGAGGTNSLSSAQSGLAGSAGKDGVAEAVLVLD